MCPQIRNTSAEKKFYLICDNEPLQSAEYLSGLRAVMVEKNKAERLSFDLRNKGDWLSLQSTLNSLSLFSSCRLFEINVTPQSIKIGKEHVDNIFSNSSDNDFFIFKLTNLSYKDYKSKWFTSISQYCEKIVFETPKGRDFLVWISNRFNLYGKKVSKEAATFIAEKTEGNLVAASHEILKIDLLLSDKNVTLNKILGSISNGSYFEITDLREAFLRADIEKIFTVLRSLENSGNEIILVKWILQKELKDLYKVRLGCDKGMSIRSVMKEQGIWGDRANGFEKILKNRSAEMLLSLIIEMNDLALKIKGADVGEPWRELEYIITKLFSRN